MREPASRLAAARLTCRPRVQLHLVDATYELFRAHFAPRPPVLGRDGIPLSGVSGLCDQLLYLLREEGATHVGCATDRVIESFRNDLFPGYKSSAGMPPELLAQFPIAEAAVEALGIVLWPMVEFEADDAIAAAAVRFGEDPRVERILVCTPDKDMAQLVRDERIVLWDRRRDIVYDDAGVRDEVGRRARLDPRLARPRRRHVGRLSRASRLGRQVGGGRAGPLRPLEDIPPQGVGLGGAGRRWLAGDDARRDPARPLGRGAAVPRPGPPADRRRRRPDPPDATPTSCAGTARRAPSGRRSARNGASTGSGRGPIAGSPRADERRRGSGRRVDPEELIRVVGPDPDRAVVADDDRRLPVRFRHRQRLLGHDLEGDRIEAMQGAVPRARHQTASGPTAIAVSVVSSRSVTSLVPGSTILITWCPVTQMRPRAATRSATEKWSAVSLPWMSMASTTPSVAGSTCQSLVPSRSDTQIEPSRNATPHGASPSSIEPATLPDRRSTRTSRSPVCRRPRPLRR